MEVHVEALIKFKLFKTRRLKITGERTFTSKYSCNQFRNTRGEELIQLKIELQSLSKYTKYTGRSDHSIKKFNLNLFGITRRSTH